MNPYGHKKGLLLKILLLVTALAVVLPQIARVLTDPRMVDNDDFAEYWASARLTLTGQNPYDLSLLFRLYRAMGRSESEVVMWNPPWTLALVMPLGLLPYPVARTLWFLLHFIALAWSFDRLGHLSPGKPSRRWIALLFGFTFEPVLLALKVGQISTLILTGLVGVLVFFPRRPFIAGLFAALMTVKPHTVYLVILALIVWTSAHRQWKFLLGFVGVLSAGLLIAIAFHPVVLIQYIHAWTQHPPTMWVTATLGGLLRFYLGPEHFALQFVAPLLGLLWFTFHLARYWNRWVWTEQLPLLAVVSTATTAYGWIHDFQPALVGLLPAVLQLLPMASRSLRSATLLVIYILIQAVLFTTSLDQLWYFWLGPAMLVWFLLARRHLKSPLFLEDRPDETAH